MNDMSNISPGYLNSMQSVLDAPEAFIEMLPVAVCVCDSAGKIVAFNRRAARLWGRKLHFGGGGLTLEKQASNEPGPWAEAIAERPDGTQVPFIPFPTPLHDAAGKLIGGINMLVDITDRKRAEERPKTMVDELNHRVKNTWATVQSLAAQTLRAPQVPKDVRGMFEARLFTLSRAHDHLTRAHWKSADLKSIAEEIFVPYRYLGLDRLKLHGEPVEIASHAAVTLSMILHELATNATRYGALLTRIGHVDVAWSTVWRQANEKTGEPGGRRLIITWRETDGPTVEAPLTKGFGMRLLENGVTQGLKGRVDLAFDPTGLRCEIDIPFPLVTGL